MRVAIAGAGNVGQYVARTLEATGYEVLLIEQDPEVVERAHLDDVEWHVADACEFSSLAAARVDTVDVMVAVTGDDEDNLVISLLAKQEFAVPRVIARVNHPENSWLFTEAWGVDVSVSTPHLVTALVQEALTVGDLVRLLMLEGGKIRLVEVTLAEDAPVVDRRIMDLDVPRDATFVAVVRHGHVFVPRGDTTFAPGDEVLALVTPHTEDDVRQLLTRR
ncbi:MAG: TrkA family potassium uptake protein [Actinomycetota bacterium]|nr:TrkA family potassium uptake protein [Actinomycetota bacterium]